MSTNINTKQTKVREVNTVYHSAIKNKLDLSKFKFSKNKKTTGFRWLEIFNDSKYLGITLPAFRLPFDASFNKFKKLEVLLSLDANNKHTDEVTDFFKNIEEQMIEFAIEHKWFDENESFKFANAISQNGNFAPLIKFRIAMKESNILTKFYDNDKKKIEIDSDDRLFEILKKNTKISVALEASGVWLNKDANGCNKFGITWTAEQIKIAEVAAPIEEPSDFEYSDVDSDNSIVQFLFE